MGFMAKTNFQLKFKYLEKTKGHCLRKLCRVVEPFLMKWMQKSPEDDDTDLYLELERAVRDFRLENEPVLFT
jgi:hypothetical protein